MSSPVPPIKVSLPEPPSKVSLPEPPSKVLFPEFPVRVLSKVLPVASILLEPVRVKFSTLLEAVKVTEDCIKSVPSEEFSVTVSLVLSTT